MHVKEAADLKIRPKTLLFLVLALLINQCFIPELLPLNAQPSTPSVVGISSVTYAIASGPCRNCFPASGLYWAFYFTGTPSATMGYCTSSDGQTWSNLTAIASRNCYIWYNGSVMDYVSAYGANNSGLFYRRGIPQANGTITWPVSEQTVVPAVANITYLNCFAFIDSNGYPWITYVSKNLTDNTYYPFVTKAQFNNGTWGTTPSGFPYKLSTTSSSTWMASVTPLTSGKILALYGYQGATLKAQSWNTTNWSAETSTASILNWNGSHGTEPYSSVAQGDNAQVVYMCGSTTYSLNSTTYVYKTNSFATTEQTITTNVWAGSFPWLSIDAATNNTWVFWAGTPSLNHIYCSKCLYATGTWGSSPTDWVTEGTLQAQDRMQSWHQAYNNSIGLEYGNTTSTTTVKFVYLNIPQTLAVVLNAPAPATPENVNSIVSLNYTAVCWSDTIQNSSLWTNSSGTWKQESTNSSAVPNNVQTSFSFNFTTVGTVVWNVEVFNSTTGVFASSNYTVSVVNPPVITGISPPASGDWIISANTTAKYETNLIINGSIVVNDNMMFYVQSSVITINGNFSTVGPSNGKNVTFTDTTFYMNATGKRFTCDTGMYIFNASNLQIINCTGTTIGTIKLSGTISTINQLYLQGYSVGVISGNFTNFYSTQSTNCGLQTLYPAAGKNITVTTYAGEAIDFYTAYANGTSLSNVTVVNPLPGCTVAVDFWGSSNCVFSDFYIETKGMLQPHMALQFGGGAGGVCDNNTVANGTQRGNAGNGLFRAYQIGTNYVKNVTIDGAYDNSDGDAPPIGSSTILVTNCTFLNGGDHGLSGDNFGGGRYTFVNCIVNDSVNTKMDCELNSNGSSNYLAYFLTNVTFVNPIQQPWGFAQIYYPTSFVYQQWNFSDGTYVEVNTTYTQNGNATLLPASLTGNTLTYSIRSPSGTNSTSTVFTNGRESPSSVSGASSWSYDPATDVLTINATHASTVTITIDWTPLSSASTAGSWNGYWTDWWYNLP